MRSVARLRSLSPNLRAALLPCARWGTEQTVGLTTTVTLAGIIGPDVPAYLRLADRDMEFVMRSEQGKELSVDQLLSRYIFDGGIFSDAPDIFSIVTVLAALDELFTKLDLYQGHVYIASERAMSKALHVAGADSLEYPALLGALNDLQALELLYRFPVARRFRQAYDGQSQCRLSGWGRRLGVMLVQHAPAQLMYSDCMARLQRHLEKDRERYEAHFRVLLDTTLTHADEPWESSMRLRIPVLC